MSAKTSNYKLVYQLKAIDIASLKRLIKEIKSITGMKPTVVDDEGKQLTI